MMNLQTELVESEIDSAWLVDLVAECLDVPAVEIDRRVPLVRYGLDSMSAVHLTMAIANELGCDVPEWLLLDYPDIESIERYVQSVRMERPSGRAQRNAPASLLQQMLADSVLPGDVRPEGESASRGTVQNVLLTGASGFLGAYLLRSLLRTTDARIHCLVRANGGADDSKRIRENMEAYGAWEPSFEFRVCPIAGDLLLPQLGMAPDQFDFLCRDIDAVFHCAAAVNWVLPYAALREVNVLGTIELLRLACRTKTKPFHFVSSMAVCYSTSGPTEVDEQADMLAHLSGIHLGYAQSKCVAEALVRGANERGLPVATYRPSLISGDTQSGISNTTDFLATVIRGCVQMGSAPDLDWPLDCCPVDYVADAIVGLSRLPCDSLRVYHLANPNRRNWRELILWMNLFGYPIKRVSYAGWLDQMQVESKTPEHPLHALRSFFLTRPDGTGLTLPELYEETRRSRMSADRTQSALSALAIRCPELNATLLDGYFNSFIARGLLPPVHGSDTVRPLTTANRLNHGVFEDLLRRFYGDETIRVRTLSPLGLPSPDSIVTELTSWRNRSAGGLSRHRIHIDTTNASVPQSLEVFVKVKVSDQQVLDVGQRVAALCGERVGRWFAHFKHRLGAAGCHVREAAIYEQRDDRFVRNAPGLVGTLQDNERGDSILVLENLSGTELMDSASDVSSWRAQHFEAAVRGIAELHAIWYGREQELLDQPWIGYSMSATAMAEMKELWAALADHARPCFSEALGNDIRPLQQVLIASVGRWWQSLDTMPRTLIHNDFNPRNITFRRHENGLRLCAFDWELAAHGVPQHDLAELLCFTIPPDFSKNDVLRLVELHRAALEQSSGRVIDDESWRLGFKLSLCDLILNRFPMYCLMHTFRRLPFLTRVIRSWRRLYDLM
jgi:thioester reductase-like protein